MTAAESQALQQVARSLNFGGKVPSVGQARAACGAAAEALKRAYAAAGRLPSGMFGGYSSTQARRDLDGVNSELGTVYKLFPADDRQQNEVASSKAWATAHPAILRAYTTAFAVRATAEQAGSVTFIGELAKLDQNLAEAPAVGRAILKAAGGAAKEVLGAAGDVAGAGIGAALKALMPLIVVLVVLIFVLGKTSAGGAAIRVAERRLG